MGTQLLFIMIPMQEWNSKQVAEWLSSIKLAEYAPQFVAQQILGMDLVELTDEELEELGFTTVGQKKLFRRSVGSVSEEREPQKPRLSLPTSLCDSPRGKRKSCDNRSVTSSTSSPGTRMKINCLCKYKQEVRTIYIPSNCSYNKLKWKIRAEFDNSKTNIFYEDEEGDLVSIKKDSHTRAVLKLLP